MEVGQDRAADRASNDDDVFSLLRGLREAGWRDQALPTRETASLIVSFACRAWSSLSPLTDHTFILA